MNDIKQFLNESLLNNAATTQISEEVQELL